MYYVTKLPRIEPREALATRKVRPEVHVIVSDYSRSSAQPGRQASKYWRKVIRRAEVLADQSGWDRCRIAYITHEDRWRVIDKFAHRQARINGWPWCTLVHDKPDLVKKSMDEALRHSNEMGWKSCSLEGRNLPTPKGSPPPAPNPWKVIEKAARNLANANGWGYCSLAHKPTERGDK